MLKLNAKEARAVQKANPWDTWTARSHEANRASASNASNRLWKEKLDIGITPKFSISPADRIFAMGSCFAREIEEALVGSGFEVSTHCDQLFEHPLLSYPDKEKAAAAPTSAQLPQSLQHHVPGGGDPASARTGSGNCRLATALSR